MKVSCVQMDMKLAIAKEDADYNFSHARMLIAQAVNDKHPDVVILPEMWNIGFFPLKNLNEVCDQDGVRTQKEIGSIARELKVNIVAGSVGNVKGNKIYNTSYVFDREGKCIYTYDKMHSFSYSGEHNFFDSGRTYSMFQLDGINCGLIICYDIRFPEFVRSIALEGVDVMFVVSQWPVARIKHLDTLSRARAIENQVFLALSNSVGTAYGVTCGGSSALIDPWGEYIVHAGNKEEIIAADFKLPIIQRIRETINVFRDRKPELYKIY